MNFQAAIKAANEDAQNFTLENGAASCPLKNTGLVVLVYGGPNDDAIENVDVKVAEKTVKTGADGIARFLPIKPDTYTVHAERPNDTLIAAPDEQVQVMEHRCQVVPMRMPQGVKPEVQIVWASDSQGVKDVDVKLEQASVVKYTFAKTGDDGSSKWTEAPMLQGTYDIKAVFPDGAKYVLFDEGGKEVKTLKVAAPGGKTQLRIKKANMTVQVQVVAGSATTELKDAKVKIVAPEIEKTTAMKDTKAVAEFTDVPVQTVDGNVTIAQLTPDADEGAYEVMEVTST